MNCGSRVIVMPNSYSTLTYKEAAMDELYGKQTEEPVELDFKLIYNKHYITVDDQGRVTAGWSDGPHL